jgi:hypothetical protein
MFKPGRERAALETRARKSIAAPRRPPSGSGRSADYKCQTGRSLNAVERRRLPAIATIVRRFRPREPRNLSGWKHDSNLRAPPKAQLTDVYALAACIVIVTVSCFFSFSCALRLTTANSSNRWGSGFLARRTNTSRVTPCALAVAEK